MKIEYRIARMGNTDIVYYSSFDEKEIVRELFDFSDMDNDVCVLMAICDVGGIEIDDTKNIWLTPSAFIDKIGEYSRCANYMDWMFTKETSKYMPSLMTIVRFYDGEYHGKINVSNKSFYEIDNPCPDEIVYMMKQKLNEVIEGRK